MAQSNFEIFQGLIRDLTARIDNLHDKVEGCQLGLTNELHNVKGEVMTELASQHQYLHSKVLELEKRVDKHDSHFSLLKWASGVLVVFGSALMGKDWFFPGK